MAPTRCHICLSAQKEYIEEMIEQDLPFKVISGRMMDVYEEVISADSLKNHKAKHMTSESDLAKEVGDPDKPTSDKILTPTEEIAALKARINALELVAWIKTDPIQFTSWVSYSLKGPTTRSLTYQGIVEEGMPDKDNIKGQYDKLVASIRTRRIKEDGEPLTDEFVGAREALRIKTLEEAKIAEAEAEIAEQMAAKQKAQDAIRDLGKEDIEEDVE